MKYLFSVFVVCLLSFSSFGQSKVITKQNSSAKSGMVALSGKTFGQEELKGKIVVLNFWYTSCPPCLKEIPELNKIVAEYQGKDVVFLGLATDDVKTLEGFLKEHPFDYEIIPKATQLMMRFLEPDATGKLETTFPLHIVVNREGKKTVYEMGMKGVLAVDRELKRLFQAEEKPKTAVDAKKSN